MNKNVITTIAGLALAVFTGSAFAGSISQPIMESMSNWTVGVGQLHQDYKEFINNGSVMDAEKGGITSLAISGGQQHQHFGHRLTMSYSHGDTSYTGSTWGGTPVYQADGSSNTMVDLQEQMRYGWGFGSFAILPTFTLGIHDWERGGKSTATATGYNEGYANLYYGLGVTVAYAVTSQFVVSATGIEGHTLYSGMQANLPGGTRLNFRLGDRPWSRVGVTANYQFNQHFGVFAKIQEMQWKYGKSSSKPLQTTSGTIQVFEPLSTTVEQTALVGIRFAF